VPETGRPQDARPIRSENRALLIASIAQGRRWLNEIMTNPAVKTDSIAVREGCSARQVNMAISLAFLAPDLVKAAIEGRLPHGHGVTRMRDLPAEWPRQRQCSVSRSAFADTILPFRCARRERRIRATETARQESRFEWN
jgi:hypothetical protein